MSWADRYREQAALHFAAAQLAASRGREADALFHRDAAAAYCSLEDREPDGERPMFQAPQMEVLDDGLPPAWVLVCIFVFGVIALAGFEWVILANG